MIRLAGIAPCNLLQSMILNQPAETGCHKKDKYRRQVCVVYFDGEDVNLQMVGAGLAWHYKEYQHEQSRRDWRAYARAGESSVVE